MKRFNPKQPRATLSAISLSRFKSRLNTRGNKLSLQSEEEEDAGDLTTESTVINEDLDSLKDSSNVVLIKLKENDKFRSSPRFQISHYFKLLDANTGQCIYFIGKKQQTLGRCCCGRHRGYEMFVFNPTGRIIMMMGRRGPFECCYCCDDVCDDDDDDDDTFRGGNSDPSQAHLTASETISIQNVLVSHAVSGTVFGTLKNYSSALTPQYAILDKTSSLLMTIQGPRLGNVICCKNKRFRLYDARRKSATEQGKKEMMIIGEISRGGSIPSGADLSVINGSPLVTADFPKTLPHHAKAMIVAAMVEMNVTYFDRVVAVSDVLAIVFIFSLLSATVSYFYLVIKYFL